MQIGELKRILNNDKYADAILSAVLDAPRTQIKATDFISDKDAKICKEISKDWRKALPIAQDRGKWRFYDMPFFVSKDVHVPIFFIESLVDATINHLKDKKSMLELGTGSGCVAIAIAKHTGAQMTATDVTPEAIKMAELNAKLNNVDIQFIQSDMFKNIKDRYDAIISNPPCSTTSLVDELEQAGSLNRPRVSCDGGKDGLHFYRIIVANSKDYLKENGVLALMLGYDHIVNNVHDLVIKNASFKTEEIELLKDVNDKKRVLLAPTVLGKQNLRTDFKERK